MPFSSPFAGLGDPTRCAGAPSPVVLEWPCSGSFRWCLNDVEVVRLPHAADLPLPSYQSASAAGLDLLAAVPASGIVIAPGRTAMIPTGIAIALPPGFEGQIRPRSGLAANHGVTVLNAPGTIDSDYRGEVLVILINHGSASFAVTRGMRIAN